MKRYALLIGLILLTLMTTACVSSFSLSEQKAIEGQLQQVFREQGYKGQVAIDKFGYDIASGDYFTYTYKEVVDGRQLTFKGFEQYSEKERSLGEEGLNQRFDATGFSGGLDENIKQTAMWHQPYVEKKLDQMAEFFRHHQGDFVFAEINGEIKDAVLFSDEGEGRARHDDLLAAVHQNRANGGWLNGYYSLDVADYMAQNTLQIRVDFKFQLDGDYYDLEEHEEETIRQAFFDMVTSHDYSRFWDGTYLLGFDWHSKSGRVGSIQDMIYVTVKDGKVIGTSPALVTN